MKTCKICGSGRPPGSKSYCAPCAMRKRKESEQAATLRYAAKKRPKRRIPCATCQHGQEMAESDSGWCCVASIAGRCVPTGPKLYWVAR